MQIQRDACVADFVICDKFHDWPSKGISLQVTCNESFELNFCHHLSNHWNSPQLCSLFQCEHWLWVRARSAVGSSLLVEGGHIVGWRGHTVFISFPCVCSEPSLAEKRLYVELCEKLVIAQKQLGRAYGILVLGIGLCEHHHMACGRYVANQSCLKIAPADSHRVEQRNGL